MIVKSKNVFSPHVRLLVGGLSISVSALLFQEVVGHYLGGDIPSRGEISQMPFYMPNILLSVTYLINLGLLGLLIKIIFMIKIGRLSIWGLLK